MIIGSKAIKHYLSGYYQSYSGANFEKNPYEVKPVEKGVTVFESI